MDELKNIIATFVKKDPAEIDGNTLINKRVIYGSILLHRMYAAINNAGYNIKDYNGINTYGELLAKLNGAPSTPANSVATPPPIYTTATPAAEKPIGIDIESVSNFPVAADFREDSFYRLNFSMKEISYCILKEKPLESFAGLFSAKEALCKVSERVRKMPFSEIEISHDENGKPTYPGYSISISHTSQFSIAIAMANEPDKPAPSNNTDIRSLSEKYDRKIASLKKVAFAACFIAVVAVIVSVALLIRVL